MKTKFNLSGLTVLTFCVLILIFSSCKKGDTGPKGDTGAQGPQGNANIQSFTFTKNPGDWQTAAANDLYVDLPVPAITQDIVDKGMVIIYWNISSGNVTLPFSYYQGSNALTLTPSYRSGHAYVDVLANVAVNTPSTSYTFRVVVVAGAFIKNHPDINWLDSDEVEKKLNLHN